MTQMTRSVISLNSCLCDESLWNVTSGNDKSLVVVVITRSRASNNLYVLETTSDLDDLVLGVNLL